MEKDKRELDELLSECKQLLGEQKPSAQPTADEIHIDYEKFYGEDAEQEQPAPARPLTAYEQSKPAYQTAKRQAYAMEKEAKRAELTQNMKDEPPSADSEEYADWLFAQGQDEQTTEQRQQAQDLLQQMTQPAPKKPKRRKRGWLRLLIVLSAIVVALLIVARQPRAPESGRTRIRDTATILLAGTDEGGLRTDTLVLMRICGPERTIHLVSVPRDTLVLGNYSVPKINSAYGYAGGGADGMEELFARIADCIGFRPDGYVLVDLACFEKLVDVMGGVRYNVPMPMQYSDPTQNLEIHLTAGEQTLSGKEALQLVRYRSGYAAGDLERINVQRSFLQEAIRQWASPLRAVRYPAALVVMLQNAKTDFSIGNWLWLAGKLASCSKNVQMQTLPGVPKMINGGSYYVLDATAVAETVNETLNPYEEPVGISDFTIRNG